METKFRRAIYGFAPIVVMMLISSILVLFDDEIFYIAYSLICGGIFFVWYRKVRNTPSHENFVGYRPWIILGLVMLAVALQYLTGFVTEVVSVAAPSWEVEYEVLLYQAGMTEESVSLILIIYTVLGAPIVEELCFRGLTYSYLRKGIGMWPAVIVQALLFAGFHGNYFQASYTLVFGLFMGYIYAKSENIYLTIALHIGYNFIAMFASQWIYLGDGAISFYCILLTTMVACYVGLMLVVHSIPQMVENHKK